MTEFNYEQETKIDPSIIKNRETLYELFEKRPMPVEQLLINPGLFMRSGVLAKILFVNELYEMILHIPGIIMEFGIWWGQNIALLENLRAIYEPFNQNRRVVGFDTFEGYQSISDKDKESETIKERGYTVSDNYKNYLEQLIAYHESNNILSNIKKHSLIKGNVIETVPQFFKDNPEVIVAAAYFDLALYAPTLACLEAIKPNLVRGSVVMLDELNWKRYPGETIAFKEAFKDEKFTLKTSRYMPDRTFLIMD